MPYQPGKAAEVVANTEIEWEREPIAVSYRKRLVQSELLNMTEGTEIEQARNLRGALETLIVSWDVIDADGTQLPATAAVTRHFEFDFLLAVFRGIVDHATPGEAGGGTSSNGSIAVATSARARKSTR